MKKTCLSVSYSMDERHPYTQQTITVGRLREVSRSQHTEAQPTSMISSGQGSIFPQDFKTLQLSANAT